MDAVPDGDDDYNRGEEKVVEKEKGDKRKKGRSRKKEAREREDGTVYPSKPHAW